MSFKNITVISFCIIFLIGPVGFDCSGTGGEILKIEPDLEFSSYLGGSRNEMGYAFTTDLSGNIYLTGKTNSPDFLVTTRFLPENAENSINAFVVKLDPTGSNILFSIVFGGSGDDSGMSVEVNPEGFVYVSGNTNSTDFPTTPGVYSENGSGLFDAFAVKISPDGKTLAYSTLLGGNSIDYCLAMAVDKNGFVYVGGKTFSDNFPVTPGVYDEAFNGKNDIFVAKLNKTGSELEYSTFMGGGNEDSANGIFVDDFGYVYLTGETQSSDYPVTENSLDAAFNEGGYDAIVTKLNPEGTDLVYSTYLGGNGYEWAAGLDVDGYGNVYVSGATKSEDFPVTENAYDKIFNGDQDLFVTVLDNTGNKIVYSTFVGGESKDSFTSIGIIKQMSKICLTGNTQSVDYPVSPGAFSEAFNKGQYDTFLTIIDIADSTLDYSTFLGGSQTEWGLDIFVDNNSNIYLAGFTDSPDFPVTPDSFGLTYNGESEARIKGDVFILKFQVEK